MVARATIYESADRSGKWHFHEFNGIRGFAGCFADLRYGNRIFPELLQEELKVDGGYVRVYDSRETFIGLYEKKTDQMIPVKMFYRKENEA